MAALLPAVDRIAYLLGFNPGHQGTPVTIHGGRDVINSYGLTIVGSNGDGYLVKTEADNSRTTNRHIQAAHAAIQMAGYHVDPSWIPGVWTRYTKG